MSKEIEEVITKEMPKSVFEAVRVDCDNCGHPVIMSLKNPNEALKQDLLSTLRGEVEELKKNGLDGIPPKEAMSLTQEQQQFVQWESIGYNQAINAVLSLLDKALLGREE